MERERAWESDAEIERSQSRRFSFRSGAPVRPPSPLATYGLLLSFLAVYILEFVILLNLGVQAFNDIFTIHSIPTWWDWVRRPWSPITATLSHSVDGFGHILFNSISLYFFAPTIEAVLGRNRFLGFFVVAGAASSIGQAILAPGYSLGASGAIMGLIGLSIILTPKSKLFFFPFPVPIPLWVAGIIFAALDLLGTMNPDSGIGNFAHLIGLGLGLAYGPFVKRGLERRGLRLVTA